MIWFQRLLGASWHSGKELVNCSTLLSEDYLGPVCSPLSVQVAPPVDGAEEIATVKLTITGDGVNVEEQKKVLICKARNGTIIQTEKAVYEPGQTGEMQMGATVGPRLSALYGKTVIP